jgi:16S rRNA (guanine527-N7)-methyltransferase
MSESADPFPSNSVASNSVASRLNALLVAVGLKTLEPGTAERFAVYCALLLRWNARMNLTAVRDEDGILSRHFVESIACAQALPSGIATLLDLGSGAGFPGIPIALCRPEIAVTLAESQGKKAAFLQEAVRTLGLSTKVHSGRAEALTTRFDCVTLRAVDHMQEAAHLAAGIVLPGGWLAVMTSQGELEGLKASIGAVNSWRDPHSLPGSESRVLALCQPIVSLSA